MIAPFSEIRYHSEATIYSKYATRTLVPGSGQVTSPNNLFSHAYASERASTGSITYTNRRSLPNTTHGASLTLKTKAPIEDKSTSYGWRLNICPTKPLMTI